MLDSLLSTETRFLSITWMIVFSFVAISVLLIGWMTVRRIWLNGQVRKLDTQKSEFEDYISAYVRDLSEFSPENSGVLNDRPDCPISGITAVLLHYFRTLSGDGFACLQNLVSLSSLEHDIIEATKKDNRGRRMQALKVLSYLNSQSALEVIYAALSSEDKYVRLTAARGLVRRKTLIFLPDILRRLSEAFPQDHELLATIISSFGIEAQSQLETLIRNDESSTMTATALEALAAIMPPKTSLDLAALMAHPDPIVRSSVVTLAAVTEGIGDEDPLVIGLHDEATKVKIRSARIAHSARRADLVADLYPLTEDPIMWVRYWAFKAIWASGQSGRQLVGAMSEKSIMAGEVALELRSGYV